MTHLTRGDADLHDENGEHRNTPPTTNGRALAQYEHRLRAHLERHQWHNEELAAEEER